MAPVGVGRRLVLLGLVAGALAWPAAASAVTPQELTIAASDGTQLACALVEPDGTPPAGGWPAVMLFHGLGGKHEDEEPFATTYLAPAGYASLMCDARGHGASGGLFGLDGPVDVQDTRELFAWLTARPEISDTQIGALGISLGGGAVWNAVAAGDPVQGDRPGDHVDEPPHRARAAGSLEVRPRAPARAARAERALGSRAAGRGAVARAEHEHRAGARARDAALRARTPPVDHDADAARPGPARLPLRHRPGARRRTSSSRARSACTSATSATRRRRTRSPRCRCTPRSRSSGSTASSRACRTASTRARSSSSRTTRGTGRRRRTRGCRRRRRSRSRCRAPRRSQSGGKVARGVRITGGPHETFGDTTVTVHYSGAKSWDRLVAVLAVAGQSTPISAGGIKLTAASGTAKIRLMNESVRVPAGARARRLPRRDLDRAERRRRPLPRRRAAGVVDHHRPRDARALGAEAGGVAVKRALVVAALTAAARRSRGRRRPHRHAGRHADADRHRRHRPADRGASRRTSRC